MGGLDTGEKKIYLAQIGLLTGGINVGLVWRELLSVLGPMVSRPLCSVVQSLAETGPVPTVLQGARHSTV